MALRELNSLMKSDHLIAASLMGIIALNTVKRICPYCKVQVEHELSGEDVILAGKESAVVHSYIGTGCKSCDGTGYMGNILIHEGFETSPNIRNRILESIPLRQLRIVAKREGMRTLLDAAWNLVEAGETTLDEVTRIADITDPGTE
jgi:type II secretory ATPase GspE/PulE/Tfp pilus assembly ATPase PilB-like protein